MTAIFAQAVQIRAHGIDLAVRAALECVAANSGAANNLSHPAQRLYREAVKAYEDPALMKNMAAAGMDPWLGTPEQMGALIKNEMARYAKIIAAIQTPTFRDLIELNWECGARPQEIRKIEARFFDPENNRVVFPPKDATFVAAQPPRGDDH